MRFSVRTARQQAKWQEAVANERQRLRAQPASRTRGAQLHSTKHFADSFCGAVPELVSAL